jgi:hypothetical protein
MFCDCVITIDVVRVDARACGGQSFLRGGPGIFSTAPGRGLRGVDGLRALADDAGAVTGWATVNLYDERCAVRNAMQCATEGRSGPRRCARCTVHGPAPPSSRAARRPSHACDDNGTRPSLARGAAWEARQSVEVRRGVWISSSGQKQVGGGVRDKCSSWARQNHDHTK